MKKNLVLVSIVVGVFILGGIFYFKNIPDNDCSVFGCQNGEDVISPGLNSSTVMGDVIITPIEVLEDSRCPLDVTCIWAGVLSVKVKLQNKNNLDDVANVVMNLTNEAVFNANTITIKSVEPLPYSGVEISPKEYIFHFNLN